MKPTFGTAKELFFKAVSLAEGPVVESAHLGKRNFSRRVPSPRRIQKGL